MHRSHPLTSFLRLRVGADCPPLVTGRVLDSAGAALPGANVTLLERATGRRRSAVTGADGTFRFEQLEGQEFRLTVTLSGFAASTRELSLMREADRHVEISLGAAAVSEEVTVTASRVPAPLSTVPASVTVLERREIEQQAAVSRNLNDILSRTVPGIGPSRETEATFGQSLRGRDMLVLIDGVSQNFDLRIGATDELSRIDPSTVERVEVVRGATSLYGSAAAGGIVNIITKRPEEGHNFETNVGTTFSATHPSGSFAKRVSQTAAGRFGSGDYFVGGLFEDTDGEFDADGDRIPQLGLGPQSDNVNLSGKLGFALGPVQRLQLGANFYRSEMERFFGAVGGLYWVRKAQAVELLLGSLDTSDRPQVPLLAPLKHQQSYRLDYEHGDLFGSSLKASLFYLDYFRRNTFAGNLFGGRFVRGGTLEYGATTFNVGGVVNLNKRLEVFASFAQGFSITEVGRLLRNTRLPSVDVAQPEAQKVDNSEFGLRGRYSRLQFSLSGFYSTSELGTTFFINPATGIPEIIRSPERVGGVEATVDARPFERLGAGGTFSWQRGEHDPDRDGAYAPLPGFRIAPPKLTLYADHTTFRWWRNRVQLLYTGGRDEFPGSLLFGEGRVRPVYLVDLFSEVDLPRGAFSVGVANLFNRFYFPAPNQAFNSDSLYIAGRGATVTLNYRLRWSKRD